MSEDFETEVRSELKELREEIHELKEELARYRGAVGAALVIATSLVAVGRFIWSFIKDHVVWQ